MSVGLVLVTHGDVGSVLLDAVIVVMGGCPVNAEVVQVVPDADVDEVRAAIEAALGHVDTGDGALVITDMFGGTPSNLARDVAAGFNTRVVTGLNMPMLVRVLNYYDHALHELAVIAVDGGKDGIFTTQTDEHG